MNKPAVLVIIPAYNEAGSIAKVIGDIPSGLVREVVVVDNGSSDGTAEAARAAGATVLYEGRKGYGSACLCGIEYAAGRPQPPDIIVFLDGDYSDFPGEMGAVCGPVLNGQADLVIGSRTTGRRQRGSMMPQQVIGNRVAVSLIRWLYGFRYTDLGPFRAIRFDKLSGLGMKDTTYGWTVEMQVKAVKKGLRVAEVPVSYRKRVGVSKVSGTVRGTLMAGYKIILTILKYG